jgi:hypothetical protein
MSMVPSIKTNEGGIVSREKKCKARTEQATNPVENSRKQGRTRTVVVILIDAVFDWSGQ